MRRYSFNKGDFMQVPSHIAIIMDGNGRWAEEKSMPRRNGHYAGVQALKRVIEKAGELDVACLTVYAFSTENWKRPKREIDFLMALFCDTIRKQADELNQKGVQVKIIGRRKGLSDNLLTAIKAIEESTEDNAGLSLNIAFNYGGRTEILDMFRSIKSGEKDMDSIKEEDLKYYLYNSSYPDVELLIRTGGEKRLSNFMLWQSAYAELYFVDKYWPDFNGDDLEKAIQVFSSRDRRYGGLKEMGEK
ncbi:MAG: polyprenyl diphosphate synthase [Halanaerobiales bacterium]